jgi:hypothetical protein
LENQESWQDVHNILQIHGKKFDWSANSPITQMPHSFEKTYKRKHSESALKNSETWEEESTKNQKLEEIEEEGET